MLWVRKRIGELFIMCQHLMWCLTPCSKRPDLTVGTSLEKHFYLSWGTTAASLCLQPKLLHQCPADYSSLDVMISFVTFWELSSQRPDEFPLLHCSALLGRSSLIRFFFFFLNNSVTVKGLQPSCNRAAGTVFKHFLFPFCWNSSATVQSQSHLLLGNGSLLNVLSGSTEINWERVGGSEESFVVNRCLWKNSLSGGSGV